MLMKEVETLLGFHKVSISAYHPQTDGFIERYLNPNINVRQDGIGQWTRLGSWTSLCFVARSLPRNHHSSSPIGGTLNYPPLLYWIQRQQEPLWTFANMALSCIAAWDLVRQHISLAQKQQKIVYDWRSRPAT